MIKAAGREKMKSVDITEKDIKQYLETYSVALKNLSELVKK